MKFVEYVNEMSGMEIAITGMAVRFPQSRTSHEFWHNIIQGRKCVTFFSEEELLAEDIEQSTLSSPVYVRVKPYIESICDFDAAFFGYSHKGTQTLDSKSRVLHEIAYHALEGAGHAQYTNDLITGVFVGASEGVDQLQRSLSQIGGDTLNCFESGIYGHKDLLAHLIVYNLNLNGSVHSLYTSYPTSLNATHIACRSLLFSECDLVLAGGTTIDLSQKSGYFCRQDMIRSIGGHYRPLDSQASDALFGGGVGAVVLWRSGDALATGDRIYTVIRGSAVNDDGKQKIGFVVPGHKGQKAVICVACRLTEVSSESVDYIETHGTGTRTGDPAELAALAEAFDTSHRQYCTLGVVRANIGHTHMAAGVTGLVKAALALYHRIIPPFANYQMPNSKLSLAHSPSYIPIQPQEWLVSRMPPRAGVSSLGIGDASVHMILEELNPAVCDDHNQV